MGCLNNQLNITINLFIYNWLKDFTGKDCSLFATMFVQAITVDYNSLNMY
jgi:hypothetical protein